ncbi:MAG TPA: type III secretion system outer membrane ring subunit SctC [Ideonella sp.]|uniref:type III secretion system outer membrane ring subunit SctC n=1 Tax=Ideonella sp. TaxID=1929293 RepID=UPI002E362268|nr:type III secretion system outer membrane ring subunit SctC [Ideonella sp.]HEX5687942.1 type III secretion system outer membrane ring subunit SctC [Ideonella sp.]
MAHAAELRWSANKPVRIVASEKKLADFLRELAASQGTTAVVDPKIDGVISGTFGNTVGSGRASNAKAVLEAVCANYGLTWYFDGSLLFVELAADARNEVLPILGSNAPRIADTLNKLQVWDKRYPLVISQNENSVFVSGPKRYVEMVRQIVKSIDYRASQVDHAEVKMFPLRYAWANDLRLNRDGGSQVVPGVVTTLRSLYGARSPSVSSSGGAGGAAAVPKMKSPKAAAAAAANAGNTGAADGAASDGADANGAWGAAIDGPQFQADARMNAVLIRDVPERMAQYAKLIASMDAKPRLVEIELTIMDVSDDSVDKLGVDWRAHGTQMDVQTGNGSNPPLTWSGATTAAGQTGLTVPSGVVITASLGKEMRDFLLARVSALASNGRAKFVARPKVLTLDNTEASLQNKSEFYVKVPGFQDSSLYTISAGTDVRVTPLVIDEEGSNSVKLAINIGDDSLATETVDNIPIVRRRSVNTQAMIGEGKSLLIAGYSSESKSTADSGVPGLSAIPVIGRLFKYSEDKGGKLERFYLLTPRFVMPDAAVTGAAPTSLPSQEVPVGSAANVRPTPLSREAETMPWSGS